MASFGNTIITRFIARDEMSRSVATMKKNVVAMGGPKFGPVGNLVSGFNAMGGSTAIAALGIGALATALGNGIRGAIEEERAIARLNSALAQNVSGWNDTMTVQEEVIDSRRRLGFTDNELRQSLGMLATRSGNLAQAFDEQQLAIDLAITKQISLEDATKAVNLAMMGNTRGIKELGIELTKTSSQADIFAAIQDKVAGASEAAAETTAGKWAAAQSDIDETLEDAGKGFIDFVDVLGDTGDQVQSTFDDIFGITRVPEGTLSEKAVSDLKVLDAAVKETGHVLRGTEADFNFFERISRKTFNQFGHTVEKAAKEVPADAATAMQGLVDSVDGAVPELRDSLNQIKRIMDPKWIARQGRRQERLLREANRLRDQAQRDGNAEAVVLLDQLIADIESRMKYLDSLTATPTVHVRVERSLGGHGGGARPGGYGRRQHGGRVNAGEPYIVGEAGRELFVPDRSGTIARDNVGMQPINVYVDGKKLFEILDRRQGRAMSHTSPSYTGRT